ncbi:unnamed protein product [Ectocarpus sp. 4 AP-2014]
MTATLPFFDITSKAICHRTYGRCTPSTYHTGTRHGRVSRDDTCRAQHARRRLVPPLYLGVPTRQIPWQSEGAFSMQPTLPSLKFAIYGPATKSSVIAPHGPRIGQLLPRHKRNYRNTVRSTGQTCDDPLLYALRNLGAASSFSLLCI